MSTLLADLYDAERQDVADSESNLGWAKNYLNSRKPAPEPEPVEPAEKSPETLRIEEENRQRREALGGFFRSAGDKLAGVFDVVERYHPITKAMDLGTETMASMASTGIDIATGKVGLTEGLGDVAGEYAGDWFKATPMSGEKMDPLGASRELRLKAGVGEDLEGGKATLADLGTAVGLDIAGGGLLKILTKGGMSVARGFQRFNEAVDTKFADDIVEAVARADTGDAEGIKKLKELIEDPEVQKKIVEWERADIKADNLRLGRVGGSNEGMDVIKIAGDEAVDITKEVRRSETAIAQQRQAGNPDLLLRELIDDFVDTPYSFRRSYLQMNTPDDVFNLGRTYMKNGEDYVEAAFKNMTPEQQVQATRMLEQQPAMLAHEIGDTVATTLSPSQAFGARMMLNDLHQNMLAQAKLITEMKFDSNIDILRFWKLLATRQQMKAELTMTPQAGSQIMGMLNTATVDNSTGIRVAMAQRAMDRMPEIKGETQLIGAVANLKHPHQLTTFMNRLGAEKDGVFGAWINGLLSSPDTHRRNILSNVGQTFLKPYEDMINTTGLPLGVRGGDERAFQYVYGVMQETFDYLRTVGKRGTETATSRAGFQRLHEAQQFKPRLSTKAYKDLDYSKKGGYYLSRAIAAPTDFMGKQDSFFKSINYRGELRRQATMKARELTRDPNMRSYLIQKFIDNPTEDMRLKAFRQSEAATFQTPLSENVNKLVQTLRGFEVYGFHPAAGCCRSSERHIIFVVSASMTPLRALAPAFWKDIAAGGTKAAIAEGKLAASLAVPFAVTQIPATMLTGSSTPQQRDLDRAIPPYSISLGDGEYWSYKDFEILRVVLGTAADLRDVFATTDWTASDGEAEAMKMLAGTAAVYGNMVGDSFFLFQASTFVDALHDAAAEGNWGKLRSVANQYAQSMLNPGVVRWISRQVDPVVRETHSLVERIASNTPGLSGALPPRVDPLGRVQDL